MSESHNALPHVSLLPSDVVNFTVILLLLTAPTNSLTSTTFQSFTSSTSATAIASPCDLVLTQSTVHLYVSHAGTHVILYVEPNPWTFTKVIIPKIKAQWKDVALSLHLPTSEISAIEKESYDLKECCQLLMTRWLDTSLGCTPKTWHTLLMCIKDVEGLVGASEEINIKLSMLMCVYIYILYNRNNSFTGMEGCYL